MIAHGRRRGDARKGRIWAPRGRRSRTSPLFRGRHERHWEQREEQKTRKLDAVRPVLSWEGAQGSGTGRWEHVVTDEGVSCTNPRARFEPHGGRSAQVRPASPPRGAPLYIISPCRRLDHTAQLHGASILPIIYSSRHGNGRAHPRAHNAVAYGHAKLADVCRARIAQDDDAPAANI